MIWGYPYFRKPQYIKMVINVVTNVEQMPGRLILNSGCRIEKVEKHGGEIG